jgi:hypothetical protein
MFALGGKILRHERARARRGRGQGIGHGTGLAIAGAGGESRFALSCRHDSEPNHYSNPLDPDASAALEASVKAGEHASIEAAAVAVIDEWWADRAMDSISIERLRRMIPVGVDSGPSVDGEAVFARLSAKYKRMAEERG